jgi:transposase InsO family protein
MGRPGSALDNAVIEAWHSTLEFELRRGSRFAIRAEARPAVADWIDDYNRTRRHSALGMRSPIAYERELAGHPPGRAAWPASAARAWRRPRRVKAGSMRTGPATRT